MGAKLGLGAVAVLAHYISVQIAVTLALGLSMYPLAVLAGRVKPTAFARAALPAQAVAASTQSSLASLPPMLAGAKKLAVAPAVSSVVLPLAVALFRIAAPASIVIVTLAMARMNGIAVGPATGVPIELLPLLLAVDTIPGIFYTVSNVTADLALTSVVGRDSARHEAS